MAALAESWVALSIAAFLVWSVSAFLPKLAVQSLSPFEVLVYSTLGCLAFVPVLFLFSAIAMAWSPAGIFWAAISGVFGMLAQLFYIFALRDGKSSVVFIVTALYPIVAAAFAFFILKEQPSAFQYAGIALALAALVLVVGGETSGEQVAGKGRVWLWHCFWAFLFFGLWAFFPKLALQTLSAGDVLIYEQIGNVAVMLGVLAWLKGRVGVSRRGVSLAFCGGFVAMGGVFLYFTALHLGPVSTVTTLSALYPVGSVLLARLILKEHIRSRQYAGMAFAMGAIALMASG